jgi:hypothetical protein
LLSAERAQHEVERELSRSEPPIDEQMLNALKLKMAEANGALEAAGQALEPCESRTRELALRYAR